MWSRHWLANDRWRTGSFSIPQYLYHHPGVAVIGWLKALRDRLDQKGSHHASRRCPLTGRSSLAKKG
jgi:hypothetical protein